MRLTRQQATADLDERRTHESHFLACGPAQPREIAASLSEWTTARHRLNAQDTVVFHAGDRPASLDQAVGEATRFVEEIARGLSVKPQPYRNHPYWRGAMAAFDAATGKRPDEEDWRLMLRQSRHSIETIAGRLGRLLLGRAPEVRRMHPRIDIAKLAGLRSGRRRWGALLRIAPPQQVLWGRSLGRQSPASPAHRVAVCRCLFDSL